MKRHLFLFLLLFTFFLFFCNDVNASSKLLGTVYNNNSYRNDSNQNRLNLLTEFNEKSNLANFIIDHGLNLGIYLNNLDSTGYKNFISVFSKDELGFFNIKSGSSNLVYNDIFKKCVDLNCSYVFISSRGLSFDDYWFTFDPGTGFTNVYYFDFDLNFLDSSNLNFSLKYYYPLTSKETSDFTSLLNILLFNDNNTNLVYNGSLFNSFVLQYLNYNGIIYNLNNESGKNFISNFFYNIFNNDKSDIDSSYYSLLNNNYIQLPLIDKKHLNNSLYFINTVFEDNYDLSIPDGYVSVNTLDNDKGFYFIPTLNNVCTEVSDYDLLFYSDVIRLDKFYIHVLDNSLNVLGSSFFNSYNAYELYKFHLIDNDLTTLENINNRVFYFYKNYSAETITMYYNPQCLSFYSGNISDNIVVSDSLTIPTSITSTLMKKDTDNYYGHTNSVNSWQDDRDELHSKEFNVSSIINNSYNNLTGLFSSVSAALTMVTVFLTGLPVEIYTVLVTVFSLGVIILLLKLFL